VRHPTPRLRLGSVLFVAVGMLCALLCLAIAAGTWLEFLDTRAAVASQLGRMP
jgi:hypothetical protein